MILFENPKAHKKESFSEILTPTAAPYFFPFDWTTLNVNSLIVLPSYNSTFNLPFYPLIDGRSLTIFIKSPNLSYYLISFFFIKINFPDYPGFPPNPGFIL